MTLILFLLLLILPLYPLYSVNSQYIKFLNPQESWRPDCRVLASFRPKRVQDFCLQHTELPPPSVSLTLELSPCITHVETKLTAKPWDKELSVSTNFTQTLPSSSGCRVIMICFPLFFASPAPTIVWYF